MTTIENIDPREEEYRIRWDTISKIIQTRSSESVRWEPYEYVNPFVGEAAYAVFRMILNYKLWEGVNCGSDMCFNRERGWYGSSPLNYLLEWSYEWAYCACATGNNKDHDVDQHVLEWAISTRKQEIIGRIIDVINPMWFCERCHIVCWVRLLVKLFHNLDELSPQLARSLADRVNATAAERSNGRVMSASYNPDASHWECYWHDRNTGVSKERTEYILRTYGRNKAAAS